MVLHARKCFPGQLGIALDHALPVYEGHARMRQRTQAIGQGIPGGVRRVARLSQNPRVLRHQGQASRQVCANACHQIALDDRPQVQFASRQRNQNESQRSGEEFGPDAELHDSASGSEAKR